MLTEKRVQIKDLTLLVLAAGMGSRYGGIKQIDGFGPNGETIVDYSIYDAIRAGFTKVVFIVREDIKDIVREKFENKLKGKIKFEIAIQSLDKFVPDIHKNKKRPKPWGTAHALLCAREVIHEPFVVINADDFYGKDSFQAIANYFATDKTGHPTMVGYTLEHVLSKHGSVSRGIGETDNDGFLKSIIERKTIVIENGKILAKEKDGTIIELNPKAPTSMNFWGFYPDIFDFAQNEFEHFVQSYVENDTSEFLIPLLTSHHMHKKNSKVKVLNGGKIWFGVTYKEDKETVSNKIQDLISQGQYPAKLWR